jgi:predicted ATPase
MPTRRFPEAGAAACYFWAPPLVKQVMNEQLVVKNFGPIQDATVDFKRVTVFIGPTGGGKSTLAKLAAVFRDRLSYTDSQKSPLKDFGLSSYVQRYSLLKWLTNGSEIGYDHNMGSFDLSKLDKSKEPDIDLIRTFGTSEDMLKSFQYNKVKMLEYLTQTTKTFQTAGLISSFITHSPHYIPSERAYVASIDYSWAGMLRDDIGLPKTVLGFANAFSLSRKEVLELDISLFNVKYIHANGHDFIKIPEMEEMLRLNETASGIQSVTPLLVLLEHLSRNTEQAQSFIIEEPELNLYPTAQQGLLNWLVEKCTKGENDLTITTHSPYILSHLNLLLYAYQVAEQHPDRRAEVAAIVPEASWINPKEFACYQVENGGVDSLVNDELGMIDNNELDALSGDAADAFDNLIRLSKGIAVK